MSYELRLADSARGRLAALPVEVQEAVLDVLDALAADPDEADERVVAEPRTHRLRYGDSVRTYDVFIVVATDHEQRFVAVPYLWYVGRDSRG